MKTPYKKIPVVKNYRLTAEDTHGEILMDAEAEKLLLTGEYCIAPGYIPGKEVVHLSIEKIDSVHRAHHADEKVTKMVELAEAQILGYHHARQGGNMRELCDSMGLSSDEYKIMHDEGMLGYLTEEETYEIEKYLYDQEK